MSLEALLADLCDGASHPLAEPLAHWVAGSRRFAAFAQTHRTKIRKKLRGVRGDAEAARDLAGEMETARWLLRERRFAVVYEPGVVGAARSPDLAVRFTTRFTFNVEVTRMRPSLDGATPPDPDTASREPLRRWSDVICAKLGQLVPQQINLVCVVVDGQAFAEAADLSAAMAHLVARARSGDERVCARHGYRTRAEFQRAYQRLSGVLVRVPDAADREPVPPVLWLSPEARVPLPAPAAAAILSAGAPAAQRTK
jgi:hypothetical protein